MTEIMKTTAENLKQRGYGVNCVDTANEARELVLSMVENGESVGIGGSVTIKQLGLYSILKERGHSVSWHWEDGAKPEVYARAHSADVYLSSANAISKQGHVINIDGSGNRVAALFSGPKKVIMVVSADKITSDRNAALARIKNIACPQNARRLSLPTPCSRLDRCDESECPIESRMCREELTLHTAPARREFHIIICVEKLGF